MFFIYLLYCCYFANNVFGAELPDYMKKCSLSDPQINDCLKENANSAIPELVKGIPAFGVPLLEPAHIRQYHLNACDFQMILSDAYVYGFGNLKVSQVNFSPLTLSENFQLTFPYLNITANYIVTDGDAFTRTFHGGGKVNISLLDNVLGGECEFRKIEKAGEELVQIFKLVMKLSTQGTHYKFHDIDEKIEGDVDRFINAHTTVIEGAILPGLVKLITERIRSTIDLILMNVPFDNIFNP